jgi:tetratricopeptide (TPR) repeat protein
MYRVWMYRAIGFMGLMPALGICGLACDVCSASDAADNPATWRRIAMDQALKTIDGISDPYRLALSLTGAAHAQLLIDDPNGAEASLRRALDVAARIPEPEFKGWALHDIVTTQIAADDLIGARQTADQIAAERPRGSALAAIADIQLRSGKLANAQATAARIRDDGVAGSVLRQIVVSQLNAGALAAARETARNIDDHFYAALALGDIAVAEVLAGNIERANAAAVRAHRSQRAQVEGRIAIARAQKGDMRGALETLTRIDDVFYRAIVQGQIAGLRAAAGDTAEANGMFMAALNSLDGVRDRGHRMAITLSQLALLQAASGNRETALDTLQRAIAATAGLTTDEQRDNALDVIARGQMRLGDNQSAFATALQVKNRISRALLVRDVVAQQVRAGTPIAAVRSAVPAEDSLTETAALFGILGTQLVSPDRSSAADTIVKARRAVRSIDDVQLKPAAFASLAAARVTLGDAEGGWEIFQEALTASTAIERPEQRAAAYVRIVNALNDRLMFLGQPARSEGEHVGWAESSKPNNLVAKECWASKTQPNLRSGTYRKISLTDC